ncbi:DUF4185 domain-containing protein [Microbacterium sp. TWP3-1-2b2]|uniref:DUF4185 domain-containing protein n=1 Tax=Microbacterium sp. TWP3-1-2b2 TaxID=2804651 RepID=UPI003CE6B5F8
MFTPLRKRATAAASLAASATLVACLTPMAASAAPPTTPPPVGVCNATPDGSDIVVSEATENTALTEAWRQFGNSGGGWDNQGGWAAADGTYSTEVPGHGVVWLFNDTWLGPVNGDESLGEAPGLVNNSAVIGGADGLPDTTITGGTQDDPTSLAGPLWQWNGDGIFDGGKLRVIEFEQAITDDPPPWNFGWVGTTLATFDGDFAVEDSVEVPTANNITWGVELVACGDFIYIYGAEAVPLEKIAHIARVPVGHLADISSWEYFDGQGWNADPTRSARVARQVGASFAVTPIGDKWVLSTTDSMLGDTIYVSVADSPVGPFTERQPVYVAPEAHDPQGLYAYNVAAHPSMSEPGTLTISYNVNSSQGFEGIQRDANVNRPRFLDVHFDSVPDTTRPETALVAPVDGAVLRELTIDLDATDDSGLQRIVANVYQGKTLIKSTQTPLGGATEGSHSATVALPDGSYTVKYNAEDIAGNISRTRTVAVTVDTTAPTATVKKGASFTQGEDGVYEKVSFKLHDAVGVDQVTINGVVKDLTDNVWSDVNFIEPGRFGAVEGENVLVVLDRAGNAQETRFILE